RLRLAVHGQRLAPAQVQGKTQPGRAIALECFQRVDMQRTAARTGIEFGLEHADAQVRQGQPLAPTQGHHPRADRIHHGLGTTRWISGSGSGASEGNRTIVSSLGSYSSTLELHPPGVREW